MNACRLYSLCSPKNGQGHLELGSWCLPHEGGAGGSQEGRVDFPSLSVYLLCGDVSVGYQEENEA